MADLNNQLQSAAGTAAAAGGTDPNFKQTVLLLHGDGTNGAQNNTFLDGSTNNFTITRNGNTTQGTFSPFSVGAGEFSNFFDGNNSDLTLSSAVTLTSDYTLEAWVYKPNSGVKGMILGNTVSNNQFNINAANKVEIYNGTIYESTGTITINQWAHVAVSRSGSTLRFFIDGQLSGTHTDSSNISFDNIGELLGSLNRFVGYLSNVRIVSSAVYTSAFTPSTTPLTAITNTQLLTCQSNRFVDNSASPKTFTISGAVRVTPFSPFAPSAAYSASTNGGSGYFDGTGDFLQIAHDVDFEFGSGDFTIEFWAYANAVTGAYTGVVGVWVGGGTALQNSWNIVLNAFNGTSKFGFSYSDGSAGTDIVFDAVTSVGSWNHYAVVRSGSTLYGFKNGVSQAFSSGSSTITATLTPGTADLYIGTVGTASGGTAFNGYISGLRIQKGTAQYTSNFTPPTAPPTAITNTQLLTNFTNAGIFDNTGKNNLETVGDAQIDTGTKKYGTGSMEFDGTGDWLLMANTPDQQLGTGNFTIEFWVYLATGDIGSARGLVAKGTSTTGFLVSLDSSQKVVFTFTTSTITSSGAITTNAWNHIAVVREGTGSNLTKIYINGTNDGTGTVSTDFNQTSVMYVGCNRTAGDPMKGFIDDLRITKGVARYTAAFTAPTKAFPDQ